MLPSLSFRNLPIKGREHFFKYLCDTLHWTLGAELGVKEGRTTGYLLTNCSNLKMYAVDLWSSEAPSSLENYKTWNHLKYFESFLEKVKPYWNRVVILKTSTTQASYCVPDESLDFIFIDAEHSYKSVLEDITNWSPKVKSTGFIIGHDINWPTVKQAVDEKFPNRYYKGLDNT